MQRRWYDAGQRGRIAAHPRVWTAESRAGPTLVGGPLPWQNKLITERSFESRFAGDPVAVAVAA